MIMKLYMVVFQDIWELLQINGMRLKKLRRRELRKLRKDDWQNKVGAVIYSIVYYTRSGIFYIKMVNFIEIMVDFA